MPEGTTNSRLYGAHISITHGFDKLGSIADQLDINAIQIHPTAPQRYATKPIDDVNAEALVRGAKDTKLKAVFLHAIYLINLAQPDKQKFHLSKVSLVTHLEFQHTINHFAKQYNVDLISPGVIVHVGSAKHYPTEQQALERAIKGINWILKNSPKDSKLLLEISAGSGKIIGDTFEELRFLRENSEHPERIGFALDTQHMFASGYNIQDHPTEIAKQISDVLQPELIGIIHVNDSATDFNSHKDRHANLGEGTIGTQAIKEFINFPQLKHAPLILETPNCKSIDTVIRDIKLLKKLI